MLRSIGLAATTLLVAGCVGVGAGSTSGAPDPSAAPAGPSSSLDPAQFSLRAWRSQALAPWQTFGWLPSVTIANGQFIDGNIAIPAIYPGPVYLQPSARPISAAGVEAIVAEARKDGLLSGPKTFGEGLPGGVLAHIEIVVNGVTNELTAPMPSGPAPTTAEPGTAAGFDDFWNKIESLSQWLEADLGTSTAYVPGQLAVLLGPAPAEPTDGTLKLNPQPWPLVSTFASFGSSMGTQYRCGVVSGPDLAALLPVVKTANQLTVLVDSTGAKASLQARALMPGEPSPC